MSSDQEDYAEAYEDTPCKVCGVLEADHTLSDQLHEFEK